MSLKESYHSGGILQIRFLSANSFFTCEMEVMDEGIDMAEKVVFKSLISKRGFRNLHYLLHVLQCRL